MFFKTPTGCFNAGFVLALLLAAQPAHAMGKSKPTTPAQPVDSPANPARAVVLDSVVTQPFPLPNGSTVDLTSEMNTMLNTAVTNTATLVPTQGSSGSSGSCNSHVELRASVTTLQMNVTQLGLTVGYTPTGTLGGGVTGGNANLAVNISEIGMDFSLWECANGQCQSVAASSADQSSVQESLSLNLTIDFSQITTGLQLVNNTALGDILRAILVNGVNQLAASSRISSLPWSAVVKEVSSGSFIFDQGADSRLGVNQDFVVYAGIPGQGACAVYQAVAYGRTTEVDPISSVALITQSLDSSRSVEVGDVVMVKPSGSSQ